MYKTFTSNRGMFNLAPAKHATQRTFLQCARSTNAFIYILISCYSCIYNILLDKIAQYYM